METPTTTPQLVERAKSADSRAFSQIFRKYRARLAVIIHYRLGAELRRYGDVDDVLQETFFRAFRDLASFKYESPGCFMSWLSSIAGHVISDMARTQSRKKRQANFVSFRSESNPGGADPADSQTPSRIFSEQEGLRRLLARLDSLPADYREIILLTKVEGLSTREAAERLGRSHPAVSLLLHRAIKKFGSLQPRGERA
ncbi:MAG: RNA polymerase sigma factor [Deltaproteobacteria bacterium]